MTESRSAASVLDDRDFKEFMALLLIAALNRIGVKA